MPLAVATQVSAKQMIGTHKVAVLKTETGEKLEKTVLQSTFRQVACPVVDF